MDLRSTIDDQRIAVNDRYLFLTPVDGGNDTNTIQNPITFLGGGA